MKRNYLLGKKPVEIEGKKEMQLEYYLLEEDRKESEGPILYGIKIIKNIDSYLESEEVKGISYSKEFVKQMILRLMENDVTPISMIEIVDGFLTMELCS